ncbi:MAG: hypothetical protein QW476_04270 [Candidatus Bathyarchaeia archaeon]
MKTKKFFLTLFIILLIISSLPHILALNKMLVSISVNHYSNEFGELIVINGKISNEAGYPIQNVLVSIQVNNPNGSVIHVALVYSSRNGTFKDEFSLSSDALEGNYTIYVMASKLGYEDFRAVIPLSLFFSDFLIVASPNFIEVMQGETKQVLITLISNKSLNFTVLLQVSGLPEGIKYSLNQTFVTPFKASMLTIEASKEAKPGIYNVTIIGAGRGKVRYVNINLAIIKSKENLNLILVSTVLPLTLISILIFLKRIKRGKEDSKFDRKYLAYARALSKLEELKAQGKIGDEDYDKLRKEYEEKLKKDS